MSFGASLGVLAPPLDRARADCRACPPPLLSRCNAPIGIFLDLRKWQVLWLWAGTGSWGSNFYLDVHGVRPSRSHLLSLSAPVRPLSATGD